MRAGLPGSALTRCGCLLLWSASALFAGAPSAAQPVIAIESAQATLAPQGLPVRETSVDLARRWDLVFPGRDGRATYRIALPPHAGDEPMALLFSRVGNQALVRLNGVTLQRWGTLGDPAYDAAKSVQMVVVASSLLRADRPNELSVEVTIQGQRWGGLSVLRYGPYATIAETYSAQRRWRHSAMVVFAVSLAGMGAFAGALWWRQREPLYGLFSLAALLGMVRDVDRLWPDLPVPWPLWGAIEAACYAAHLALICRFTLMALGPVSRPMNRTIDAVVLTTSALALAAFMLGAPLLWTFALGTLLPLGAVSLGMLVRAALRRRHAAAWVLVSAGALAVAAGVYDFTMIRLGSSNGFQNQLTPPAMFVFVVIMAALVADRHNRSVADYRALNADLAQRVIDRESQLRSAFDALRDQRQQQAVANERQRIMRDIHDGVGSQLVGLLNMVAQPGADAATLHRHVQQALDEMRMAVDSLQPMHDDLVAVLATLRYRLQPRLDAAGIEVVWQVDELPTLRHLAPHAVLQIQRILLEAFTNVLKHARATRVTVQASWREDDAVVLLRIVDNGAGWAGEPGAGDAVSSALLRPGLGIESMRARALAIGAVLRFEPMPSGGLCVALDWPVERSRSPQVASLA